MKYKNKLVPLLILSFYSAGASFALEDDDSVISLSISPVVDVKLDDVNFGTISGFLSSPIESTDICLASNTGNMTLQLTNSVTELSGTNNGDAIAIDSLNIGDINGNNSILLPTDGSPTATLGASQGVNVKAYCPSGGGDDNSLLTVSLASTVSSAAGDYSATIQVTATSVT